MKVYHCCESVVERIDLICPRCGGLGIRRAIAVAKKQSEKGIGESFAWMFGDDGSQSRFGRGPIPFQNLNPSECRAGFRNVWSELYSTERRVFRQLHHR